jgi:Asp-tRNA(Asn)/Glu-tRNA(Gln) amidotransferase A subunit family amidase
VSTATTRRGVPLNRLPAFEAAALVRARGISAEELIASCLERIEQCEGEVGAWEFLDPDLALAKARARDGEAPRGPLHGVPVGLKDIVDTAEMPTACGTPIYRGRRPSSDAACVERLLAAGAVPLGKTVTTELATWHPGKTRNPHNPAHTPGGSSSGSAAAVAARMTPLALGTQTVGSTIRPAAFCGVLGIKPTFDSVDLAGVRRTSLRLDTIGVFARHPFDLRLQLEALGAVKPARDGNRSRSLRVGMVHTPWWESADADSRAALERAAAALEERGAQIVERELPRELGELTEVHDVVATVEIANHCAREYDEHAELLSERMRAEIERGRAIDREDYRAAVERANILGPLLEPTFARCHALLVPAVTGEAPHGLEWTGDPVFCRAWSMLGLPVATVPALRGSAGLPVGVQLVGPAGGDLAVLVAVEELFAGLGGEVPEPPTSAESGRP